MKSDTLISPEEHRAWFGRIKTNPNGLFYIFEKSGVPLGVMQFTDIHRENGTCAWGFYLGESELPRGTGTLLGCMGLREAFGQQRLRKVMAEVLESNKISYQLHKKLGFRIEGCLRKHIWRNARYEDVIVLSIFADDYRD